MMITAVAPRKTVFNHDDGLLKPKYRMLDLRSHSISSTKPIPKMPELKVKKGTAKSAAMMRSYTTATAVWREMNSSALSRNCAMPGGSGSLRENMMFCANIKYSHLMRKS